MDKIILKNMEFYGYHGVIPEENKLGQKFIVDIELYLSLDNISDNVNNSINYAEVYNDVKTIMENKTYKLIETCAEECASIILKKYPKTDEIVVTVKKPQAPVNGKYDYFGVEIRRKRNE